MQNARLSRPLFLPLLPLLLFTSKRSEKLPVLPSRVGRRTTTTTTTEAAGAGSSDDDVSEGDDFYDYFYVKRAADKDGDDNKLAKPLPATPKTKPWPF